MNKGGFSLRRLTGITAAKSRLSREIGIPLTKRGRERKFGKIITGGGCLLTLAGLTIAIAVITAPVVMI